MKWVATQFLNCFWVICLIVCLYINTNEVNCQKCHSCLWALCVCSWLNNVAQFYMNNLTKFRIFRWSWIWISTVDGIVENFKLLSDTIALTDMHTHTYIAIFAVFHTRASKNCFGVRRYRLCVFPLLHPPSLSLSFPSSSLSLLLSFRMILNNFNKLFSICYFACIKIISVLFAANMWDISQRRKQSFWKHRYGICVWLQSNRQTKQQNTDKFTYNCWTRGENDWERNYFILLAPVSKFIISIFILAVNSDGITIYQCVCASFRSISML